MADYLATADVWTVLDLIVAEFTSDPMSVQCFDRRIVERAVELNREHRALGWEPGDNPVTRLSARLKREHALTAELLAACKALLAKPDAVDDKVEYTGFDAAVDQIRAAVAKAEGR